MGFYIPQDDILHSDRRESLRSYKALCYIPHDICLRLNRPLEDVSAPGACTVQSHSGVRVAAATRRSFPRSLARFIR
jgi:hypothetical protein